MNWTEIKVIVNGTETVVGFPGSKLATAKSFALKQTKNQLQPPEDWQIQDKWGAVLDESKPVDGDEYKHIDKFWLTLKAGCGA